ncbi:unnamed protein product [Laminaria digitata]
MGMYDNMYTSFVVVSGHLFRRRTDHVLDHLDPNLPLRDAVQDLYKVQKKLRHYEMPRRICSIQIRLRKIVPYHADCTAPTRQHELDHTYKIGNISALKDLDREVGIDDLSKVCSLFELTFSVVGSHSVYVLLSHARVGVFLGPK